MPVINLPLQVTTAVKDSVPSSPLLKVLGTCCRALHTFPLLFLSHKRIFLRMSVCVTKIMFIEGVISPSMCLFCSSLIPTPTPQYISLSRATHNPEPFSSPPSCRAPQTAPWALLGRKQAGVVKEEKPRLLKLVSLLKPVKQSLRK